jgi:stage II sporulation protein D
MINLRKLPWLIPIVLFCLPVLCKADIPLNPLVRVKLSRFFSEGIQHLAVTSTEPFQINDQSGNLAVQAAAGASYQLNDEVDAKVSISTTTESSDSEDSESGGTVTALYYTVHPSVGGVIAVSDVENPSDVHHYRGDIIVSAGLSVVNSLPLEDYIKGVLQPEIGSSAPVEALKAQAIAARTYAVRNLGKMAVSFADMDDTTKTQSYIGADGETAAIDDAVDATAGEVLVYQNELINAVYSTDCGGMTGDGGPSEPYLAPVKDPECSTAAPWELSISSEEARAMLEAPMGTGRNKLSMRIVDTDDSGRVVELRISDGNEDRTITGVQFRKLVGYDRLKSTMFTINRNSSGSFRIVGEGWGHGLGMCQRGAIYMAQHNAVCNDILLHYYTGVQVVHLDSSMLNANPMSQQISSRRVLLSPPGP